MLIKQSAPALLILVLTMSGPPVRAVDLAKEEQARHICVEAENHYRRGAFKDALRLVDKALTFDPGLGVAYELRARLRHVAGDFPRQKEDATRALELFKNSGGTGEIVARGGALLLLGKTNEALESFNAALKAAPQDPAALAGRARAWREKGELIKAVEDLDVALKAFPSAALWLYARAHARYDLGENAKTLQDLTAVLKINKDFPLAFTLIAAAFARQDDFDRATKAYEKAMALDPTASAARLGRAAIKLRRGDEPGALKDLADAIRADGKDYAPYYNRAELHWREGRKEQALADFHSAAVALNLTPEAALMLGDRFGALQLWTQAREVYKRAHDLRPGAASLVRRARAEEALKDLEAARTDLDEAVKLEPDYAPALAARGLFQERAGRDKAALQDLTRAVQSAPADPDILTARAGYYARARNASLALADFNAAIRADGANAAAYNGRGTLFADAVFDPAAALRDVTKAAELKPLDAGYQFNLGSLRLRNRLYLSAIAAFDAALALKGPGTRVLERRADAKFQVGDRLGAMQDIESALRIDPKSAGIYDSLGYIRLREHDHEQAVRDLNRALELNERLLSARMHRGLAYGALGKFKEAAADFEFALELEPRSKETWTHLCHARRLLRDARGSLTACDRALALDVQHGPAYLQRALTRLGLKEYARVIEDVDSAWQLGARRAEGQLAKSISQAALGRYKEAHKAYQLAIELDPYARGTDVGFAPGQSGARDFFTAIGELEEAMPKAGRDPYVPIIRADRLHNVDRFDAAAAEYTKAMAIDGTAADAYVGRGDALTAQDSVTTAQQDFTRALELEPDNADARVKLAVVLTMRRDYRGALVQLARALKSDPKNAAAYLRAANAHYFLQEYPKALENYELAVKADPLDANALNGLGLGYLALRRRSEALENFSRAIAVNPLIARYYRNRASVWTAENNFDNAAGDFKTAGRINTDPELAAEYKKLIETSEARAKRKPS